MRNIKNLIEHELEKDNYLEKEKYKVVTIDFSKELFDEIYKAGYQLRLFQTEDNDFFPAYLVRTKHGLVLVMPTAKSVNDIKKLISEYA